MRKKIKSVLLFVLTFALIITTPVFSTAQTDITFTYDRLGDVNCDGNITAADARLALRYSAELKKDFSEYQKSAADFNGDGTVTAADARLILRVSSGLEKHPFDKEAFTAVLQEYTEIMDNAKTEKPAFTMIYYCDTPDDPDNRYFVFESTETAEALEEIFRDEFEGMYEEIFYISRDEAIEGAIIKDKGSNMAYFPVFNNEKGCLLTDVEYIKNASSERLPNGNQRVTITLIDELNPEPTPTGGDPLSKTGSIFDPVSQKLYQDNMDLGYAQAGADIGEIVVSLPHSNATATLEYNPETKQIVSLKHEMTVSFTILVPFFDETIQCVQNLYLTYEWYDLTY